MTSSTSTPKLYTSRFADMDLDMVADTDIEGDLHVGFAGSSVAAYDRLPGSAVRKRVCSILKSFLSPRSSCGVKLGVTWSGELWNDPLRR